MRQVVYLPFVGCDMSGIQKVQKAAFTRLDVSGSGLLIYFFQGSESCCLTYFLALTWIVCQPNPSIVREMYRLGISTTERGQQFEDLRNSLIRNKNGNNIKEQKRSFSWYQRWNKICCFPKNGTKKLIIAKKLMTQFFWKIMNKLVLRLRPQMNDFRANLIENKVSGSRTYL